MSEENIELQNNKSYSKVRDDNLKDNSQLDNCSISKTENRLDNLNLANTCVNDYLKTSIMFTHTNDNSNNILVKNNILSNSSQLNNSECKYIIEMCNKIDIESADMNSQDEKIITKITEKNLKYILPLTSGEIDINTQQFIDLNLRRATLHLQQPSPHPDICKHQSIEHMDSDDSFPIKSLMSNELSNVEENIVLTGNDLNLSNQEQDTKLLNQDQHPEIIAFRAMCKLLMKLGATDNNAELDNENSTVVINNRIKQVIFEQVNTDELKCINYKDCKPSTSTFTSTTLNSCELKDSHSTSKRKILHKRRQRNNQKLYLSSDSSSDSINELEYTSCPKRAKCTKKQNLLPLNSKLYSDKIIKNSNSSNKIDFIFLTSSEDEELLTKNKFSESKNNIHKNINNDSLELKSPLKKVEPIFRCSPYGLIHADMLNSIKEKNYITKYKNH